MSNTARRFSRKKFDSVSCAWTAAKKAAGWGSQAAAAKPGGTRVSNCKSEDTDMDCKSEEVAAKLEFELGGEDIARQ